MEKEIKLNKIEIVENKIIYHYELPNHIKKYLAKNEILYVEYPEEINLKDLNESILVIPFVSCMIGISLIFNVAIHVNKIDYKFYESIKKVGSSLEKMYKLSKNHIVVNYNEKVVNEFEKGENISVFFTGGIDATSAMVNVYNQCPILLNIFGGDTAMDDYCSHIKLEQYMNELCLNNQMKYKFIKSNCREIFNEYKLDTILRWKIKRKLFHGYWATIAHIIVMLGISSLYFIKNKIGKHIIGSSYCVNSDVYDGNDSRIINSLDYLPCDIVIDDEIINRNEKVRKIIDFSKKNNVQIKLNVCWFKKEGENCSNCEKCFRSILSIILAKEDPNKYGFNVNKSTIVSIKKFMSNNLLNLGYWKPIIDGFKADEKYWMQNNYFSWIVKLKINKPIVYIKKIKQKIIK